MNESFRDFDNGRFYLGECLETMASFPDGIFDMVMCDLPYGTTQNKWDSVIPLSLLWAAYKRVCKPNAAIVLTAQAPFDKMLGASAVDILKYEWIWLKSRATGHLNSRHQPMKNHENVLVFYRDPPCYNPQGLIRKGTPTVRRGGDNGTNYGKSDKSSLQEYEGYPRSVLEIPSEGSTVHPTQKPVALFEYLIKTYTNERALVLDNCAGSGTTAVACENLNRRWVCIEREEEYFSKAVARLAKPELKEAA